MEFNEYLKQVKKVSQKRKSKRHSIHTYYYYSFYKKNGGTLDNSTFRKIIHSVNKEISSSLLNGDRINLPLNTGALEICKYPLTLYFDNGKLVTNHKVNWNETNRLWFEDEKCRNKKQLVYYEDNYKFKLTWFKRGMNSPNMMYYEFIPCRPFLLALKKKIDEGFDALIKKGYEYNEYKEC